MSLPLGQQIACNITCRAWTRLVVPDAAPATDRATVPTNLGQASIQLLLGPLALVVEPNLSCGSQRPKGLSF